MTASNKLLHHQMVMCVTFNTSDIYCILTYLHYIPSNFYQRNAAVGGWVSGLYADKRPLSSVGLVWHSRVTVQCVGYHKGQVISKGFFGVFNFFQKTNENMSHSIKNEFICSFFGRIHSLTICFWNNVTFSTCDVMHMTVKSFHFSNSSIC